MVLQKFQDDTADIPNQSNISSLAYTLLTLNFFVAGLGYLYAPETTLQVRPATTGVSWAVLMAPQAHQTAHMIVLHYEVSRPPIYANKGCASVPTSHVLLHCSLGLVSCMSMHADGIMPLLRIR